MSESSCIFRSRARCPIPLVRRGESKERQVANWCSGLNLLPAYKIDDESKKTVYYPTAICGLADRRVSRDELLQTRNDVWHRRAVDACSGEGLQTVNGPAKRGSALGSGVALRLCSREMRWEARMHANEAVDAITVPIPATDADRFSAPASADAPRCAPRPTALRSWRPSEPCSQER